MPIWYVGKLFNECIIKWPHKDLKIFNFFYVAHVGSNVHEKTDLSILI